MNIFCQWFVGKVKDKCAKVPRYLYLKINAPSLYMEGLYRTFEKGGVILLSNHINNKKTGINNRGKQDHY